MDDSLNLIATAHPLYTDRLTDRDNSWFLLELHLAHVPAT
jgi:hypothetical protein